MADQASSMLGPKPPAASIDMLLAKGRIGRYQLIELIGHGAMGSVLLAKDKTLNRRVAIKVLPHSEDTPEQRMFFDQFIREARSSAGLVHHAIVQVFSVGISLGHAYIAMELLDGPDLAAYVKKHGPMSVDLACKLIAEAAEGLAYAHEHGVLHRDIKPANLVITKRKHCKICDFGVAQLIDADDSFKLPYNVVGTPHYLSPEAARGQSSPNADLWAVSAVLWFLLTGRPPFAVQSVEDARLVHVKVPLPNIRKLRPDLPEEVAVILDRALSLEVNRRYHSGDELAEALTPFTIAREGVTSTPPAVSEPPDAQPSHAAKALAEAGRLAGRTQMMAVPRRKRRSSMSVYWAFGAVCLSVFLLMLGITALVYVLSIGGHLHHPARGGEADHSMPEVLEEPEVEGLGE